jgi:hypothetical protein
MPIYNPIEDKPSDNHPTPRRKAPYASKQRLKEDMTASQKNGVTQWNTMIDVLKENGLMEEK